MIQVLLSFFFRQGLQWCSRFIYAVGWKMSYPSFEMIEPRTVNLYDYLRVHVLHITGVIFHMIIWIITEDLSEFVTTYCFLTIHPRRGEGPIGKLCLPGEGGIRDLFSEILPVILQSFNFQNGGGGAHPTPFIVPRTNLHFIHHILQHIITYWNIRMFWRWNLNNWL